MQIKTESQVFKPVTITLETEKEARAFYMVAGWAGTTYNAIYNQSNKLSLTKTEFADVFSGKLYDALKEVLGED